jgi:hypothetical protein
MLRLDGGPGTDSSISRSCFRSRSRPGARRLLPAPAAVPVDRFVGIGFVIPRTDRPVSAVCASVSSRPVPPALSFVEGPRGRAALVFARRTPVLRLAARAGFVAFRRALPCGVLAPAVFRPVFRPALEVFRAPAPLRAAARAPAPALRSAGVFLRPFALPAAFLAIRRVLSDYGSVRSAALTERP